MDYYHGCAAVGLARRRTSVTKLTVREGASKNHHMEGANKARTLMGQAQASVECIALAVYVHRSCDLCPSLLPIVCIVLAIASTVLAFYVHRPCHSCACLGRWAKG